MIKMVFCEITLENISPTTPNIEQTIITQKRVKRMLATQKIATQIKLFKDFFSLALLPKTIEKKVNEMILQIWVNKTSTTSDTKPPTLMLSPPDSPTKKSEINLIVCLL